MLAAGIDSKTFEDEASFIKNISSLKKEIGSEITGKASFSSQAKFTLLDDIEHFEKMFLLLETLFSRKQMILRQIFTQIILAIFIEKPLGNLLNLE